MNKEFYIEQLNSYTNYRLQLQNEITDLTGKIDGDYFKGKYPHEYTKALKTLTNLNEKLIDLNFNIEWSKNKIKSF